jgi:hypothetical protein
MGAPFSVHDDRAADPRDAQALDALMSAATRLLSLSRQVTEDGATRYAFPHHNSDAAISKTVGDFATACHKLRRLALSRAVGEDCYLSPTPHLLNLEFQRCVTENEARSNVLALGPAIAATRKVDEAEAAERSLVAAARDAGVRFPRLGDLDAGFHSPMAG